MENYTLLYKNAIIWITGDVNLPNIDWVNNVISHFSYVAEILNSLLCSGGFVQQVNSPSRGNNLLDLFATNKPALTRLEIISGINDQEIIRVTSKLSLPVSKHKKFSVE